eukprot:tig00000190_g13867.t1
MSSETLDVVIETSESPQAPAAPGSDSGIHQGPAHATSTSQIQEVLPRRTVKTVQFDIATPPSPAPAASSSRLPVNSINDNVDVDVGRGVSTPSSSMAVGGATRVASAPPAPLESTRVASVGAAAAAPAHAYAANVGAAAASPTSTPLASVGAARAASAYAASVGAAAAATTPMSSVGALGTAAAAPARAASVGAAAASSSRAALASVGAARAASAYAASVGAATAATTPMSSVGTAAAAPARTASVGAAAASSSRAALASDGAAAAASAHAASVGAAAAATTRSVAAAALTSARNRGISQPVTPAAAAPEAYDIFISHKQSTGKNLARIFKQAAEKEALELGIELSIFLDVDDLNDIHILGNNVRASRSVLLLLTKDVFRSHYVLQELRAADEAGVKIVLVLYRDPIDGFLDFPAAATVGLPTAAELKAVGLDEASARALLGRILSITAIEYQGGGEYHRTCIEQVLKRCGVDGRLRISKKVVAYAKASLEKPALTTDLELYVPPRASTRTDPARSVLVDLFDEVKRFLCRFVPAPRASAAAQTARAQAAQDPESESQVLLLVGDPGSSKSTFLSFLHREACRQHETDRAAAPAAANALPLTCLVRLTNLGKEGARGRLRQYVAEELGVQPNDLPSIRAQQGLVLLLDAYDELDEKINLWRANEVGAWASAAVITCRSAYTARLPSYNELFAPPAPHADQPAVLAELCTYKFSTEQILEYLKQFVRLHGSSGGRGVTSWSPEDYERHIERTPGAAKLVTNPFTLSMVARVLPEIVGDLERKKQEARSGKGYVNKGPTSELVSFLDLYSYFVRGWFNRQWSKIIDYRAIRPLPKVAAQWNPERFRTYCEGFCRSLAKNMHKASISEITCRLLGTDAEAGIFEFSSQRQLQAAQVPGPAGTDSPYERCVKLLTSEDELMTLTRDSCPLRTTPGGVGGESVHVRFLHKTLLEYFIADSAFEDANPRNINISTAQTQSLARNRDKQSTLHVRSIVGELSLLRFFSDRCRKDDTYRDHLLWLLARSRRRDATSEDVTAASNAITILNHAGVSFAKSYLRGIRVDRECRGHFSGA